MGRAENRLSHHPNVLLTGPTGVGKSYIACALGNFAARLGFTVLYLRAPRLFETLLQSKAEGSHLKALTRLAKIQLLILDDLFLTAHTDPVMPYAMRKTPASLRSDYVGIPP